MDSYVQFLQVHKVEGLVYASRSVCTVIFNLYSSQMLLKQSTVCSKYNINNLIIFFFKAALICG